MADFDATPKRSTNVDTQQVSQKKQQSPPESFGELEFQPPLPVLGKGVFELMSEQRPSRGGRLDDLRREETRREGEGDDE